VASWTGLTDFEGPNMTLLTQMRCIMGVYLFYAIVNPATARGIPRWRTATNSANTVEQPCERVGSIRTRWSTYPRISFRTKRILSTRRSEPETSVEKHESARPHRRGSRGSHIPTYSSSRLYTTVGLHADQPSLRLRTHPISKKLPLWQIWKDCSNRRRGGR
jgi:hypothetical protein